MGEVKWIKIVTDIFNDEKILMIESMPDSDSIIVLWFKLLCLAGKTNYGGVLMMNGRIAYTDEMLAAIFRRPINSVRLALKAFEDLGMIEIVDDVITIPNWEKHQNVDKMAEIREYNRLAQQRSRAKQKMLSGDVNDNVNDKSMTSQPCHATDIEGEREEDTTLKSSKGKRFTPPTVDEVSDYCKERANTVNAQHFVDYYEARGWKIGNNSMKDWRAAVRTWEQREKPKASPMTRQSAQASDLERMKAYL